MSAIRHFAATALALCACASAEASETITYGYDARGRLIQVARAGTINNGTSACYRYDRADNRTQVAVNTSGACQTAPAVNFSVSDVSVSEGGTLSFTVTKSGSTFQTFTVDYGTGDGTAWKAQDYNGVSGTLAFLSYETAKIVTVGTTDDGLTEGSETLLLNLANAGAGAGISDGQGVGTIQDNETDCAGVSFTIASNGAVTESDGSSVFTITKAGSTVSSCPVSYATANGPVSGGATAPGDYAATTGSLTFTAAQSTRTVSVPIANDTAAEGAETFTMSLSGALNGAIIGSPASATATIQDDDTCRGVSFSVASNGAVTEGGVSSFTVTKTGSTGWGCSVNYTTADINATSAGDYTAAAGTVSFLSSQTSQSISVQTTDDSTVESAETFNVSLTAPSAGATVGTPSEAAATINDNDSSGGGLCSGVSFSVSDASVYEGSPLSFTVTKAGTTSSSCSINYATADGTATAPTYYGATSGTLSFTSTQTSKTVSVSTVNRDRIKGSLSMYLNLSSATGGAAISDSQGIGSIRAGGSLGCTTCSQSSDPDPGDTEAVADPPPEAPE